MIAFSQNEYLPSKKLLLFLKKKFLLNDKAIALAIKHSKIECAPLPIVLWTFGLITIDQYQEIIDWIIANEYN